MSETHKRIQRLADDWQSKSYSEQRADYEYLLGQRETLLDFISGKGLFEEWVEFFQAEARRG